MNCEQMPTRLIGYLDGRAGEAERREVEAHLAQCAGCRARAEELGRLWVVLDELPALEPSLSFDARLRQRIAAEPQRSFWAWLVPASRAVWATAVLAVLFIWLASAPAPHDHVAVSEYGSEEEFRMIQDLPVLEDFEVLANFEALSELPAPPEQEM